MAPGQIKKQGYGELQCQPCGVFFSTLEKMLEHKAEKRANDPWDHIHCRFCGIDFMTEEGEKLHIQQFHPQKQDLHCPGCNEGPFIRLAGLVQHIEKGHCPKITGDTLDDIREKKMQFARQLVELTNQPLKHDFSSFLRSKNDSSNQPKISRELEPSKPLMQKTDKWPQLSEAVFEKMGNPSRPSSKDKQVLSLESKHSGSTKDSFAGSQTRKEKKAEVSSGTNTSKSERGVFTRTDPESAFMSTWNPKPTPLEQTTRSGKPSSNRKESNNEIGEEAQDKAKSVAAAWSLKKDLFPDAPAAKRPTPLQLEQATAPSERVTYDGMDPDHPSHPHFNASRYYSELLGKYACPKIGCMKCFKNARGLTSHLLSVHGDVSYDCPNCFKKFYSLTAVAAHTESSSQRCNIRESDAYGAYVDQLTAGLVDVSLERYEDGTNQYLTAESAKETFGPKKGPDGKKHVPGWD